MRQAACGKKQRRAVITGRSRHWHYPRKLTNQAIDHGAETSAQEMMSSMDDDLRLIKTSIRGIRRSLSFSLFFIICVVVSHVLPSLLSSSRLVAPDDGQILSSSKPLAWAEDFFQTLFFPLLFYVVYFFCSTIRLQISYTGYNVSNTATASVEESWIKESRAFNQVLISLKDWRVPDELWRADLTFTDFHCG